MSYGTSSSLIGSRLVSVTVLTEALDTTHIVLTGELPSLEVPFVEELLLSGEVKDVPGCFTSWRVVIVTILTPLLTSLDASRLMLAAFDILAWLVGIVLTISVWLIDLAAEVILLGVVTKASSVVEPN